ncbi:MAG: winged helix-turn-helix domain-containing protein [Coriobacteriia bacterium]
MSSSEETAGHPLIVRPHEHVVEVRGREVDLTAREYEIVTRLVEHPGWVFSAEQLSAEGDESDYSPDSVSVLVSRVRHKLADAGERDAIETIRGVGYRLRLPPHDHEAPGAEGADTSEQLRDASWRLQEVVLEAGHTGTDEQRRAAVEALEIARRAIEAALGE